MSVTSLRVLSLVSVGPENSELKTPIACARWSNRKECWDKTEECPGFVIWCHALGSECFLSLLTSALKVGWELSSVIRLDRRLPDKPLIFWATDFIINPFCSALNAFVIRLGHCRFLAMDLCISERMERAALDWLTWRYIFPPEVLMEIMGG